MSLIPFPNVPSAPGVPQIPRSPNFPPAVQAGLGTIQGAIWNALQTNSRWGIYDQFGKPLADPSKLTGIIGSLVSSVGGLPGLSSPTVSTNSVDYRKEMKVSDFPIERGSFASYNKIELPATPLVTLCMTGKESDRTKFLKAIDDATKSLNLYTVATPEVDYINYSIERYNYQRRSSHGATLLMVEIALKEIRQVTPQYSNSRTANSKSAAATPVSDSGKVQGVEPPKSTLLKTAQGAPRLLARITGG